MNENGKDFLDNSNDFPFPGLEKRSMHFSCRFEECKAM